jgi:hypothetical protein
MTISSTTRIAGPFIGNGTASAFPFTFKVFAATDLDVIKLTVSTGTESTLVLTTDYTVSLNGDQNSNPGGTVTLTAGALASGFTLTITSDIANLQPTDLTNQGGFYPEVITDSLDRATIQIQQIADIGDRTLKIPISDGTLNMELPTKTERANTFLSFDANGLPSVVTAGSSGAPATITRQVFSGTGSQTVFTLASDPGALGNSAQVYIGGVYQQRSTYTIAGTTLTFSQAPVAGTNNIEFVNFLTSNLGAISADLVTYTPSGTSAVARSAASKFGDVVSVKDFGAVGDGVTNDTAAIQAAITAAANKALYFPAGTYVATALTVSSPCRLFGDGILKKTTAANAAFLTISSSDVVIDGLEFRGASFDATPATMMFLDTAIKMYGADSTNPYRRFNISNVKVNGFAGFAMDIRWSEDVTITGCQIKYCGYAGILFESVVRGVVANNRISWIDSGTATNVYGVSLSRDPTKTATASVPTQEVTVVGNVITDIPKWTGIDTHASLNCEIVGNVVARCKNGIYAQYDSASATYRMPARNTRFDSNIVIGRTTESENEIGIASLGSASVGARNDNIIIENNIVIGAGNWSGGNGALCLSYSDNSIVRNNTVYKAIGCGIAMVTQCNRCIVENNVVNGVYGPSGSGGSIWANVHATHTNCVFRANSLLNTTGNSSYNATYGIYYVTANTGTVFARNRIQSAAIIATPIQRFIDDSIGSTPNTYTDLRWELETESCAPFTHTATGGAPREATASQISNFRRTPATGWTTASTIARARVSYRSTNTTYQIAVRPNEGNAYTVGVYTVDGTNITAATSIPDIYITIEGIYWED